MFNMQYPKNGYFARSQTPKDKSKGFRHDLIIDYYGKIHLATCYSARHKISYSAKLANALWIGNPF